jgi:gas vesicle protein
MSSTLNDTIKAAKSVLAAANEEAGHAVGTAKHAFGTAKVGAEHAASSVQETWLDGVKAVTGLVSVLRHFQAEDALGWVGLTRRRSPIAALGIFGAGALVGAGMAMLFAPLSGAETRRRLLKAFDGLKGEAESTLHRAESEAKVVGEKVEEMASHAKEAVIQAEHKVEDGASALKDLAASKVDAAVHAVKDATSSAKPATAESGAGRKINPPS